MGPGAFVAAAFVGPGTVTAATLAGAEYGYVLGWGIVFSVLATAVLQEAAARLGVVGGLGLGEAIRRRVPPGPPFVAAATLVTAAIFLGNAAYEGGNLSGAALGADLLAGTAPGHRRSTVAVLSVGAAVLLGTGRFALIKNVLAAAVAVLAFAYVGAACALEVDWAAAAAGLLPLRLPSGAEATLVALVGTTVVPYNLFLHAAAARAHYGHGGSLSSARWDAFASIGVGGAVTLAIALASAAAFAKTGTVPSDASGLAEPLRRALGGAGELGVGVGLCAAGLSSAIAAPLAAAYALAGLLGWDVDDLRGRRFRVAWGAVLLTGTLVALTGVQPVALIFLAQVANGLLLPVIAVFLLWAANDRRFLGDRANGWLGNLAGGAVVLVALALGTAALARVLA